MVQEDRECGSFPHPSGFLLGCLVDTGKMYSTANGGFTPIPLGCFPNARGKPVWTHGPYSLAILHISNTTMV